MRRWIAGLTVLGCVAISGPGLGGGKATAAEAACSGGTGSDYNGDGIRDTAIADPDATVEGKERAGRVTVVHGGGKGVTVVWQDSVNVATPAEAGDRFGYSLATYDADKDGCDDLVVGTPYEDVGAVRDAGYVQIIYGSTAGIGQGKVSKGFIQGADEPLGGVAESGDLLGYAVAAETSSTGIAYMVIGVPGEDGVGGMDVGFLHYVSGVSQQVVNVTQDSAGVWEDAEPQDRFGASLAATDRYFTVGVPGESVEGKTFAGGVSVFRPSLNTDGIPAPVFGFSQTRAPGSDASAEAADRFGTSVAMVANRTTAETAPTGALLAVGIPGEDVDDLVDAGGVALYRVNPDSTLTTVNNMLDQDYTDVEGVAAPGDFFGQDVALVNTAPTQVSSATTVKLAVGVPGNESSGEHLDKGGVQVFPAVGAAGASDVWREPGDGIPVDPAHQMFVGTSLAATPTGVLVGVAYESGQAPGAVYGFGWTAASGAAPSQTFKPGEDGIPTGGTAFGAEIQ
ncbi:FG-GAP repeat protein [Streptomyces sp. NPDC057307]|uniref:FG-GAP repeat protein n=1 Tax=Streptomyces sp. NPDC057307 TaxID=3346096 RepID=UPI00362C8769